MPTVKIVSIDAWRGPEGWYWNNSRALAAPSEDAAVRLDSLKCHATRSRLAAGRFLATLRAEGYLSRASAGRVRLDDCGSCDPFMIEVQDRATGEPLIALTFGEGE